MIKLIPSSTGSINNASRNRNFRISITASANSGTTTISDSSLRISVATCRCYFTSIDCYIGKIITGSFT